MSQTYNVSVPHDYFQKSKNDYSDWLFAFFREIIQNACDAGATTINFFIESTDDDGCQIIAIDNGHGMSEEVLLQKFMALRESTKNGQGTTGGFGVAKEIIAFAHESYKIETNGIILKGVGGQYAYEHAQTIQGVKITVEMSDVTKEQMVRKLKHWCSISSIQTAVYLNNELVDGSKIDYSHKMTVPFGQIGFNDNNNSGHEKSTLIVKMNGMAMFSRTIWTDGGSFVAELNLKGSSVDLLTSNRDGLSGRLESTLTEILNQLANNRGRLKLNEPRTFEFNQPNYFESNPKVPKNIEIQDKTKSDSTLYSADEVNTLANSMNEVRDFQQKTSELVDELSRTMLHKEYKNHEAVMSKIDSAIGSIETDQLPQNWIIRIGASDDDAAQKQIKRLSLQKYTRLAHQWRIVVNYILTTDPLYRGTVDQYGNVHVWGSMIKCGFVIDDVEAICVKQDGVYQILVNPFVCAKSFKDDFIYMIEVAAHECAHLDGEGHGESFVNTFQKILKNLRATVKADSRLRGHGINRLENFVDDNIKVSL